NTDMSTVPLVIASYCSVGSSISELPGWTLTVTCPFVRSATSLAKRSARTARKSPLPSAPAPGHWWDSRRVTFPSPPPPSPPRPHPARLSASAVATVNVRLRAISPSLLPHYLAENRRQCQRRSVIG